ncbi:MAG: hypothetical protein WCK65_12435 [Rhodospirillaceae bacterium]
MTPFTPLPPFTPILRRTLLALGLLALLLQPFAPASADTVTKAQPAYDRNLMLLGCTAGLALGALTTLLPPVAAWSAAGVWTGGLSTMILRTGLGCGYGALAGAVASAARSALNWITATWHQWTGRRVRHSLPIEGQSGT